MCFIRHAELVSASVFYIGTQTLKQVQGDGLNLSKQNQQGNNKRVNTC